MLMCNHCGEEIEEDAVTATELTEEGRFEKISLHRECSLRMVMGSLAHLQHKCGCFVQGSDENDPPGMTLREAAKAAWAYYIEDNRRRLENYAQQRRN